MRYLKVCKHIICLLLAFVIISTAGCSKAKDTQSSQAAESALQSQPASHITAAPVEQQADDTQQSNTNTQADSSTKDNNKENSTITDSTIVDSNNTEKSGSNKDTKTPTSSNANVPEQKEAAAESAVSAPEADTADALLIEGKISNGKIFFGLKDIKSFKAGIIEDDYFSLNNWGTKKYFHFKGIYLWYLLSQKANISPNASKVTIIAEDGYSIEFSLEEVKRNDYIDEQNPNKKYVIIIAWEENGKEYDSAQGKPFKLVVGQKEAGDINKPNWVQNIKTIKVE